MIVGDADVMTGIVVGMDGSEAGAHAVAWAAREANLRGETLVAVLAWGFLDQYHATVGERFKPDYGADDARAALDTYLAGAVGPEVAERVERRVVCDLAAPALLEASAGASLLVVGARGLGGFRGPLLGSVSQRCLHHARCPVAVVRHDGVAPREDSSGRVVVGTDGSDTARRAVRWAIEEARLRDASLEVVHAWRLPYVSGYPYMVPEFDPAAFEATAGRTLDAAIDGEDTTGLTGPVKRTLVNGGAAAAVLQTAEGADVVVVGSHGLGGFKGLLMGSVSHQVAHHAPCAVVVVPPDA